MPEVIATELGGVEGYEPPKIADTKGFEGLAPGTEYVDPQGTKRTKSFTVTDRASYDAVPEGSTYFDPQGVKRQKPKYEGIDFTAQTLYDMAVTDAERRKALERSYPGKLKEGQGTGELYVDDDGVLRKPGSGGMLNRAGAAAAGMALPVTGSILGAVGGSPGGVAGVAAGGAGGGILGQMFNDLILQLAGVYDRSITEEAATLGKSAAAGAAGAGVGRGIAAVAPALKGAAQGAGAVLPKMAASVLGAEPGRLQTAMELAKEGVKTPPSSVFMEAPYLHTAVETFDPKFRTQNVLRQSAEQYYERKGGETLEKIGVPASDRPKLAEPEAAVSSERAGASVLRRVREDMAREDAALEAATQQARQAAAVGATEKSAAYKQSVEQMRAAERSALNAAEKAVDAGFREIQGDIQSAMNAAKVGMNSGDLWSAAANKLMSVRNGIAARASNRYKAWDNTFGGLIPETSDLSASASDLLKTLPDNFQSKYPDIVRKIADLAGKVGKDGEPGEPIQVTLGQLHNLRSQLRSNISYYDLTPDIRDGVFKFFAKKVDGVINAGTTTELKSAAKVLDEIDAYYAKNMKTFRDRSIQAVVSAVDAGMPADPQLLANTVLKEGRTDLINKVRKMVGPNLWSAIKAADTQEMLDASRTLVPGQIDGRSFAKQVVDRIKDGRLEAIYDPATAARLRTQAQYVAMLDGKLDVSTRPGDTVARIIGMSKAIGQQAQAAAKSDPLKTLTQEVKKIEAQGKRQGAELRKTRSAEPLGFLYDRTIGASEAADNILKDKDLIFAAANKFGEKSDEFNLLRQVYAQRVLQGTLTPSSRLEKITPEIQRIMFPGASLDEMRTLAKHMDFLMGARVMSEEQAGASIAAQSRVLNPWGSITGLGQYAKPLKIIPGVETAGRYVLTKYYQMLSWLSTAPATLQWVAKGLNSGDPAAMEAVRQAVQRAMATGGPIGAGLGEAGYQLTPSQPERRRGR